MLWEVLCPVWLVVDSRGGGVEAGLTKRGWVKLRDRID